MKNGEFLGFDVLEVSSICIDTICRPGTIAKPNILLSPNCGLSTESSDKYSSQVPKMTLASLSVHKKMPMRTRPSVNLIFMFLLSKLLNNFRPGKSNGKTFYLLFLRALLLSFTFKNDQKIGWLSLWLKNLQKWVILARKLKFFFIALKKKGQEC